MSPAPSQMDIGSMHVGKALHGRILIVALLVVYFSLVGWRVYSHGWVAAWQIFHVHSEEPPFEDLRAVLQGLDRYRAGTPILEIQSRAFETPHILSMAYPSPWMWLLAPTGLGESQTILFGVILLVIVTAVTIVFLGSQTLPEGLFTAVLLMSPSFMLGIERGNADLILFPIVLPVIWLLSKRFAAAAASMLFLAALKLYPTGALLCFLRKQRLVLVIGDAVPERRPSRSCNQ